MEKFADIVDLDLPWTVPLRSQVVVFLLRRLSRHYHLFFRPSASFSPVARAIQAREPLLLELAKSALQQWLNILTSNFLGFVGVLLNLFL